MTRPTSDELYDRLLRGEVEPREYVVALRAEIRARHAERRRMIREGLRQIDRGEMYTFEEVFGEPL